MKSEVMALLASHANVDEGTTDEGQPVVVVTFIGNATGERVEIARVAVGPEGIGRLADALLDTACKLQTRRSKSRPASLLLAYRWRP
jgi:hypothetical protein